MKMILNQNQKLLRLSNCFCEGKNTVDVVIALDLPADEVRVMYRQYWELKQMYELGQMYDEAKYDLNNLNVVLILS